MQLKLYTYQKCDTCRKAVRFLRVNGIDFEEIPIREHPPSMAELKRMLGHVGGEVRRLFNTSGQDYKRLGLKDKLADLSPEQALAMLAANGNLVKRPFLLTQTGGVVGFQEDAWRKVPGLFPNG